MKLHNTGKRCAILSVKEGYQEPYMPTAEKKELPCILSRFFNEELMKNDDLKEIMTFKNTLGNASGLDYGWVTKEQSAQVDYT